VFFTGALYWITTVMITFGDLHPIIAALVNGLLVAYLSWFPACFAFALVRIRRIGPAGLLLAPAVWTATELARTWPWFFLGGFPWALLGYSQVTVLPVAQLASVGGVYGVSALVALVSAALAYATVSASRRGWIAVAAALATVLATAGWGAARVADGRLTAEGRSTPVGVVQGNIAQEQKWDPAHARDILSIYLSLTREVAAKGARVIVWPESATPYPYEDDPVGAGAIRQVARETGAEILVGSDQIERASPPRYFNAAYLIGADGRTLAVYRKMHLVPFGEYVPFKGVLFFAGRLVESVGDFTPGTEAVILPLADSKASTAICYEIVYPGLVREFVNGGSELLTTITNDAWYGTSSAPYQHFAQASMRAIEEGRYLVRAANTGISGIVDPYGRVVRRTALFERTALVGEVRFLTVRTIYARIGDSFAYGCAGLTLAALLATRRTRPN
jgi:apolipoprotein N-acyltransferase